MKMLFVFVALMLGFTARADDAFHKLLSCVRGNVPTVLRAQDIELSSTDRDGGVRTLSGRLYLQRDGDLSRASIRITAPENIAGAAYLIRETHAQPDDDMYVWLPAVRRVRHITGGFANGSLLGTDFSYAEARLILNRFIDAEGSISGTEVVDGRTTQLVVLLPRSGDSPYSRIRAWVDDQSCVVLKAEFDHGGKTRKRLSGPASALTQAGHRWYLSRMTMDDLEAGTQTEVRIGRVDSSDTALATRYFDPATFYLGR
jgi:hypothetical protein